MNRIPEDPAILLSFVNTMLRDKYKDLKELCCFYGIEESVISDKLRSIGYEYSPTQNSFK